jgi:hypothetical protein
VILAKLLSRTFGFPYGFTNLTVGQQQAAKVILG